MFTCEYCHEVFDRLGFLLHKTGSCSKIDESDSDDSIMDDSDADPPYFPSKSDLSGEESDIEADTERPSPPLTSEQLRIAEEVDALLGKACSDTVDELSTEEENQPFYQEKCIHLEDGEAAPIFFDLENLCSQEETADVAHKAFSNEVDLHNTDREENQPVHHEENINSPDGEAPVQDFCIPGSVERVSSQKETVDVLHSSNQQENSELVVTTCKISQKRVWDKKDCCIYCDNLVTNFTRHMTRNHADELEVGKIIPIPKGSKNRKVLFDIISLLSSW